MTTPQSAAERDRVLMRSRDGPAREASSAVNPAYVEEPATESRSVAPITVTMNISIEVDVSI